MRAGEAIADKEEGRDRKKHVQGRQRLLIPAAMDVAVWPADVDDAAHAATLAARPRLVKGGIGLGGRPMLFRHTSPFPPPVEPCIFLALGRSGSLRGAARLTRAGCDAARWRLRRPRLVLAPSLPGSKLLYTP